MKHLRTAVMLTLVLSVLTGLAYPLAITGVARVIFPKQARGSLVTVNGRTVGSALIGQTFYSEGYFHSRASSAGAGYDATASAGSNRGPTDRLLDSLIQSGVAHALTVEGAKLGGVPSDMVTRSASGLDPHISPANAFLQVARIARGRRVDSAAVLGLVSRYIEGRQFGLLGEPRINVLQLNIALDSAFGRSPRT